MNLRLFIADLVIRGRRQMRWLQMIDRAVIKALTPLIDKGSEISTIIGKEGPNDPAGYRQAMSRRHVQLVDELIAAKGKEEGIQMGREAMHDAGVMLGADIRTKLRLSGDARELMTAARLLYRILGIEFEVDDDMKGMRVRHCALSQNYTPLTCEVISAMDEGVVSGLDPSVKMRFVEKNGHRWPMCKAELTWRGD
jgi:hypothetical protein